MKDWEIIADNLKKAGWSYGYVSAIDSNGRTIWSGDAHCDDGKRFVVTTDEKLTAFLELSCLGAVSRHTRKWFGFSRVVRSKLRQCGNLREDAKENVGAQNFVLDTWNYLLAS